MECILVSYSLPAPPPPVPVVSHCKLIDARSGKCLIKFQFHFVGNSKAVCSYIRKVYDVRTVVIKEKRGLSTMNLTLYIIGMRGKVNKFEVRIVFSCNAATKFHD